MKQLKPKNYCDIYLEELVRSQDDMNPVSWTQGARFLYDKINL